ncbi:hypothetical protein LIER_01310 [Lithospermum erythrorhizon]|uniref:Uncharacterized protein n=1 Tax=Lithospermum erythrorhizon TaxID=34254 RepID=A0AAV3NLX9_LITER
MSYIDVEARNNGIQGVGKPRVEVTRGRTVEEIDKENFEIGKVGDGGVTMVGQEGKSYLIGAENNSENRGLLREIEDNALVEQNGEFNTLGGIREAMRSKQWATPIIRGVEIRNNSGTEGGKHETNNTRGKIGETNIKRSYGSTQEISKMGKGKHAEEQETNMAYEAGSKVDDGRNEVLRKQVGRSSNFLGRKEIKNTSSRKNKSCWEFGRRTTGKRQLEEVDFEDDHSLVGGTKHMNCFHKKGDAGLVQELMVPRESEADR